MIEHLSLIQSERLVHKLFGRHYLAVATLSTQSHSSVAVHAEGSFIVLNDHSPGVIERRGSSSIESAPSGPRIQGEEVARLGISLVTLRGSKYGFQILSLGWMLAWGDAKWHRVLPKRCKVALRVL